MLTTFELYDCLKESGDPSIVEKMISKRIYEKQSARAWNGADSLRKGTANVEYSRNLTRGSRKRVQLIKVACYMKLQHPLPR
jgi:hypothetical protein